MIIIDISISIRIFKMVILPLRVFLSILFRLSDPSENWVLGYFGYADFKNLISFALGRRILEIAIFARNTVLQVLIIKKTLETYIVRICVKNHTRQEFYIRIT